MSGPQFEHLADAEAFLVAQGFKLVPDSCDWINAVGDDAGIYPIEGRYGTVRAFRVEINRRSSQARGARIGSGTNSKEAEDYHAVVVKLNDNWRVIACAASLQWILQRRTGERHGRARWEGRSFCRTSEALNRLSRRRAGIIDAAASAVLAALPDRIEAPKSSAQSPTTRGGAEQQA